MSKDFIQNLFNKRSNYSDPDQATMQENSLRKLSSGIYTETERFVFELLQNAVDAHSTDNCLEISIHLQDGYLIFMHNGDAFTNEDIEAICFVGRKGEKARNTKKIGYKGIGFKSVFGISSKVFVRTGNLCFRFDEAHWNEYWDKNWGPKPEDTSEYTMPWQIIPIPSETPVEINEENANVATYIAIDPEDEEKLSTSITKLFQASQFLIFLKDTNIKMSFTRSGTTECLIEKRTSNEHVILYTNGKEESRWLVYQNPEVPLELSEGQKKLVEKHKSAPDKLKNATSFDLSFAIAIENGKLKKVDNAVLYTYLPTSYKFGGGFPFLVNANFITDEGRQHLDVDSEWNKVLISKMPSEYLKWIATLSKEHPNYYEVLPKTSYGSGNDLLSSYEKAMEEAIDSIAFIPSKSSPLLLRAKHAIIDSIGITTLIEPNILLQHINQAKKTNFTDINLIVNKGINTLKTYGVSVFEKKNLKDFIEDEQAFSNIHAEENANLVRFLYNYYLENWAEQDSLLEILSSTKFLLGSKGTMKIPRDLLFPSDFQNEFSADVIVLNQFLYENLGGYDSAICQWLKKLGVQVGSDLSVIKQVICRPGYITKENAIEVGQFLFKAYKRQDFFSKLSHNDIQNIKLLTKRNSLINASDAYLGSEYKPDVDLEPVYSGDIYVSEDYLEDKADRDQYKVFWSEIGVSTSLELSKQEFEISEFEGIKHIEKIINESKKSSWPSRGGNIYYFSPHYFSVYYVPLLSFNSDNHSLSQLLWTEILRLPKLNADETIEGESGRYNQTTIYRSLPYKFYSENNQSFIDGMIKYHQKMPATDKSMRLSSELFYNSEINKKLAETYLPIIDVDCTIDETWEEVCNFKKDLKISDLLFVLDRISEDTESIEENKERIRLIYDRLIELGIDSNEVQNRIKSWAQDALILSKNNEFVCPSELRYITLDGFRKDNQVYFGDQINKDAVLKLLGLMGVKIITHENIKPLFRGQTINTEISTRLLSTLPAIAILAQRNDNRTTYQEHKEILQRKIENTQFYQCESIALSYEDSGESISKATFALDGKFYFSGELRPAKIEPLLSPLCKYIGIRGKEQELFVILTEPNFSGILEYLKDKEYDVSDIEDEILPTEAIEGTVATFGGQINDGIDIAKQIAENKEAKDLVLAKLEEKGFDVHNVHSEYSVVEGVQRNGINYPLVVKSCKNKDHELFINPNEWKSLFQPNSMLWLHFGDGDVFPIHAYDLFTYQDKLTLSFDTINLRMDDRINKIMEVMSYFNNIHFEVATLRPNQRRAELIEEYLFDKNNSTNSDLSPSPLD